MFVQVNSVDSGLHAEEIVISVATAEGTEHLSIDKSQLHGDFLDIGWPVGQREDLFLIELPRETFRGFWRVWVPKASVFNDETKAKVHA